MKIINKSNKPVYGAKIAVRGGIIIAGDPEDDESDNLGGDHEEGEEVPPPGGGLGGVGVHRGDLLELPPEALLFGLLYLHRFDELFPFVKAVIEHLTESPSSFPQLLHLGLKVHVDVSFSILLLALLVSRRGIRRQGAQRSGKVTPHRGLLRLNLQEMIVDSRQILLKSL